MPSAAEPGNQEALNLGGQTKAACLLAWRHRTVWRKLNGKSAIAESDALAIPKDMEMAEGR